MTDPGNGQKTILLVEDEAVIAMAEKSVLQKHGFQVFTAPSGEKAIEAVKKTERIDLILMDINLGKGMDGTEAAEIILRERAIPVVFLSNYTQREVVEKTNRITSYGYVVKDSGEAVLIASINMAFRLHEAYRQVKKREETLRESEERFSRIFDHSSNCIAITRMSDGRLIDVNDAWSRTFGCTREEAAGKRDTDLGIWKNPADRDRCSAELEEKGEVLNFEATLLKTSEEATYLVSSKPVEINGEKCFLWEFRDITDRKRAEEDVLTSQLQLTVAADLARIAYWEHDEATDEFVFNDAFYELYGTTAEREGGYRMPREGYVRKFVHPDDQEGLRRQVDENRAGPRAGNLEQYEHRGIRGDGEVLHMLSRNRIATDPEGRVLKAVGVNQDITARKKTEEALRESETKLRSILGASRDAIGVSKDGIHVFVNPAYVSLFGYESADELIGMPIMNLIAPKSRGFVTEMVKKRAKGQAVPAFYEVTALKRDGTPFLMETNISSYISKGEQFSLVILRDVTDRKKAEKALRESEERYRIAIENSNDGIALARKDELIFVNRRFLEIAGYDREEEVLHKDSSMFVHPADRERVRMLAEMRMRGEPVPSRYEFRAVRKDGTELDIEASVASLLYRGDPVSLVYFRDITERKRAEELLRESENKFRDLVGESDPRRLLGAGWCIQVCKLTVRGDPWIRGRMS